MRAKKPLSPEAQYLAAFYERQQSMPVVQVRISRANLEKLQEIGDHVLRNRASMAEVFMAAAIEEGYEVWKKWKDIPKEDRPRWRDFIENRLWEDEAA